MSVTEWPVLAMEHVAGTIQWYSVFLYKDMYILHVIYISAHSSYNQFAYLKKANAY